MLVMFICFFKTSLFIANPKNILKVPHFNIKIGKFRIWNTFYFLELLQLLFHKCVKY